MTYKKLKNKLKPLLFNILILFSYLLKKRNKINIETIEKILVVNLGLIGDGLLITPFLSGLRKLNHNIKIHLLITPWSLNSLKNYPVDNKFIYDAFWADPSGNHKHILKLNHIVKTFMTIKNLRKNNYDLIINTWFSDQPLTAILLRLIKSKNVIGFEFNYSKKYYDFSIPFYKNKHIIENLALIFNQYFEKVNISRGSIEYFFPPDFDVNKVLSEDIERSYVVISPFTSEATKFWPLGNWAKIIDYIHNTYNDLNIIISGTKEYYNESSEWIKDFNYPIVNLVGKLNFDEFVVLVKNATLIISVESSIMHLASSFKIPIFILFSRVYNYLQFVPYNSEYDGSILSVSCAECIVGCDNPICMDHKPEYVIHQLKRFINNLNNKKLSFKSENI